MGMAEFWQKPKSPVRPQTKKQPGWFAAWLGDLKQQIAEIAASKSSQQFGREEEKQ